MITNPDQVTAQWITEALRQSQCLPRGRVAGVHIRRESSYTSTILRIALTFSPDAPSTAPARLLLKLSRPDSAQPVVGPEQRRREVAFHSKVAPAMPTPPVVRCHQAAYCEETKASSLLLDDMSQTHSTGDPAVPPPLTKAQSVMDAFAAFHAFWWDHQGLGDIEPLPDEVSVAEHVSNTRRHFPQFADALGDLLTVPHRRVYDRVLASLPVLWTRVSKGRGLTLIHGDANFSNVLLPNDPDSEKALIIDWQLYGISFSAEDLSHLMALYWSREQRKMWERDLLQRYHQALLHHGVGGYGWDSFWEDYRLAVVLRVLFMPMWFFTSGSPKSFWQGCLLRAMEAFDDLHCVELVEAQ